MLAAKEHGHWDWPRKGVGLEEDVWDPNLIETQGRLVAPHFALEFFCTFMHVWIRFFLIVFFLFNILCFMYGIRNP